jgi:fused signal recognition particle receptor
MEPVSIVIIAVIALVLVVGLTFVARTRSKDGVLEPPAERPLPEGARADTVVLEAPPVLEEVPVGKPDLDEVVVTEPDLDGILVEEVLVEEPVLEEPVLEEPAVPDLVEAPAVRPTFRERLSKARATISGYVGSVLSRTEITEEAWDELEEALIRADVGIAPTQDLLDAVRSTVKADKLTTTRELVDALKAEMISRLDGPTELARAADPPTVWLFVGVNGVGKTTTIGKIGRRLADDGVSVVMAAGDTFRAAAAEQLGTWAERCGATLVRGAEGGDPSSVIFDGVEAAAARGAEVVLADTAGRLHTKTNLMDELSKVRRVADKGAGTVTEVLLVIDATTGQNGLQQARQFAEATDVTGVVLTKLDGSAKGGIVVAIRSELGLPVKLVGLGETAGDLVDFDAEEFVEALFSQE